MLKSESVGTAELRALTAEAVQYDLALKEAIDELMHERGLSHRTLAERCGMTEGTLWNRLTVGGFRPAEQFKVARILGTDVATLVRTALTAIAREAA